MDNPDLKTMAAAAEKVRGDIPLLQQEGRGGMHYLDNAATSLMPQVVVDATHNYDATTRANIGRGLHKFAEVADENYAMARRKVAGILGADVDEVIFNSGASAGLNFLAAAVGQTLSRDDVVVLSVAEHHSNIVPWQIAAKRYGFALSFAGATSGGLINVDDIFNYNKDGRVKVFSLTHASNVSGAINDINELSQTIKQQNPDAMIIVDGAQYIPHCCNISAKVANMGADFYVFSGHKCYAPNGIGVLWGKRDMLNKLPPVVGGGGAVASVREEGFDIAPLPRRLEVGTPPITQATGLAAAMEWMVNIPLTVRDNENRLATMARDGLRDIKGVRVLFDDENNTIHYAPIVSFVMDNVHPHDCCQILSGYGVAVRGGNLCAEPLMRKVAPDGCVRVSIGPYNNKGDILAMLDGVVEAQNILGR